MLRNAGILIVLASVVFAHTEFVIEDDTTMPMEGSTMQVVQQQYKQPSSYYGYMPYTSRFYNPQMMGMGMMGPMIDQFFRTYLKWMTPIQKAEIRQMKQMGATREMMVKRVQDFYEMLPMSERRDMATMLMKAACHKMNEMVFGRAQAMNLKRAIEYAATSSRPFTSAQEVQDVFDEMTNQVDEFQKQRMINMYGPLCKRVATTYIAQMYGNSASKRSMMGIGSSMMMPFTTSSYYQNPYVSSIYNNIQMMPFQSTGKYFNNRFLWNPRSMMYNQYPMATSTDQMMMENTNNMMEQQQQQQQKQQMMSSSSSSSTEEQQQQEMMSTEQQQQQQKMTGTSMGMMPSMTSAGMTGSDMTSTKQQQQQQQTSQQMQQQQQAGQQQQQMARPESWSNTAGGIFGMNNANMNNNELFW